MTPEPPVTAALLNTGRARLRQHSSLLELET